MKIRGCFFIVCLFFIIGIVGFPSISTASVDSQLVGPKYIEVLEEVVLYQEDGQIIGKVSSGTQLIVEKVVDGNVFIKWADGLAYVNESSVKSILETEIDLTTEAVISADRMVTTQKTQVYDSDQKIVILSIEPSVTLSVKTNTVNSEYYEINFGGRGGLIKAAEINQSKKVEVPSETQELLDTQKDKMVAVVSQKTSKDKQVVVKNDIIDTKTAEEKAEYFQNNNQTNFSANDKYFEVVNSNSVVYDGKSQTSKQIGYLTKGQIYQRISGAEGWHQVRYGNTFGYVKVDQTVPVSNVSLKNFSSDFQKRNSFFTAKETLMIYDNSSGDLVPFGRLPVQSIYPYIKVSGNWYQIDFAGRIGYVYKPATSRDFINSDRYFKVIKNNIPIYDNRTGTLVKVGYLTNNQVYKRVSDYGNWHRIQIGDQYGYVLKSATEVMEQPRLKNEITKISTKNNFTFEALENLIVYDNSSGSLVPFGIIEKGKEYSAIRDYGNNWVEINFSGRTGYVYKPSTSRKFTKLDQYFKVTENNVSIYDNETGSLVRIGYLTKNQVYKRLSDYGNWHRIQIGDQYGYVLKSATEVVEQPRLKNEITKISTKNNFTFEALENLIVYDNSSGSLVPFGIIKKGKEYSAIRDYGDNWVEINFSGRTGYVYKPSTSRKFTKSDQYFKVTENNVSIYDNETGSLVRVGYLTKNQVYKRLSDYGNWHRIKIGNKDGYVLKTATAVVKQPNIKNENKLSQTNSNLVFEALENLTVYDNSSGTLVPFGIIQKGYKSAAISEYGSNWMKIDYSGRIGYVYKSAIKTTFLPSDRYFKVTNSNVSIYDNRTGSLVRIGYLTKNQVYKRESDYGNWHRIRIGDRYAYVLKEATEVVKTPKLKNESNGSESSNLLFKPKEYLPVYDNTSGALIQFGTLEKGQTYDAIGLYGSNWVKVNLSGRIGYVYKPSVELAPTPLHWRTIVIDAGHGGSDPGAIGSKYKEKNLTLQTALELASALEKKGMKVVLTRNGDSYPTLQERAKISNTYLPDVFISVHYNSFPINPSVNGIETYYYSKSKDYELAKSVHNGIINAVSLRDRGVRYGNFHVIRENSQPAILLELGYLSNAKEESIVATKAYRKQAVNGIIAGLTNYFR